jgi:hypothetical protein
MESARPRKTLPTKKATVEDYMRWHRSLRQFNPIELTPEDKAWKVEWEEHLYNLDQRIKLPNPATCASWIEPDLTFVMRVSILDQ